MERARLTAIFDRAAPLYDTLEPRFFREIARRLVGRVSIAEDSDVLDLATGPGVVLSEIARTVPPRGRRVGVDLSAGMVRAARARLSTIGTGANVFVMAAEQLAFSDESFDLVTMSRAYTTAPSQLPSSVAWISGGHGRTTSTHGSYGRCQVRRARSSMRPP